MIGTASAIPRSCALVILSLPLFSAAQNSNNPFDNGTGTGTSGAVIAGAVVAVCVVILFLILFGLMFRRRRRTVAVLPQYNTASGTPGSDQNQGPHVSYPMNQQQSWGGVHNPPRPPPQGDSFVPPPPYPGKRELDETQENSGYGYPNPPPPDDVVPTSGGFVNPSNPRPHTPPPAHLPAQPNAQEP